MRVATWWLVSDMNEQNWLASSAQIPFVSVKTKSEVICLEKRWALHNSLGIQAQADHEQTPCSEN